MKNIREATQARCQRCWEQNPWIAPNAAKVGSSASWNTSL